MRVQCNGNKIPNSVSNARNAIRFFVLLFGAGVVLATALCFGASGQDAGLDLFHKMQQALGGADKIGGNRDFDELAQADTSTNTGKPIGHVMKRTRWIRPNYLRVDQIGPGDTYVLYFNGTSGWEILPDGTMPDLVGESWNSARHDI